MITLSLQTEDVRHNLHDLVSPMCRWSQMRSHCRLRSRDCIDCHKISCIILKHSSCSAAYSASVLWQYSISYKFEDAVECHLNEIVPGTTGNIDTSEMLQSH